LVHDLLILSRADSEALNLRREAVDLAQLARSTSDKLKPRAQAAGVDLQVDAAGLDVPLGWVDSDRIEQVLVNLLDNAIKYSRPGSVVTIGVQGHGDDLVQVRVRDQGIGIRPEDLSRVGERFYRADRARSRTEGGSGLGLAIAQALVRAHGGHLSLESRVGEGTLAAFTLPRA
jgi:signal transduction histidine kinase